MQTFQFPEPIIGKLNDIVVLSQKNRKPGDNPGAQLSITITAGNAILDKLHPSIKAYWYTKPADDAQRADQGELENVEAVSDMPDLSECGRYMGSVTWEREYTGYTLVIDYGIGGISNIAVRDCLVSKIHFLAQLEGVVRFNMKVDTQDMAGDVFGKLAPFKNRDITFTLMPPEIQQSELPMQNPLALDLTAADRAKPTDPFQTPFDAFAQAVGVE